MRKKLVLALCFFLGLLPFLIRTPLTFLTDPPPWPDEAIYVDIVKTLNTTGKIATNIYGPAYPGMTHAATYYPPVYFYVLAAWTRIFGYSIISIRVLSLCSMLIVFGLLFALFLKGSKKNWIAAIGILMLSTELWFTRTAKIARMESLVFLFGTAAIALFILPQKRTRLVHWGVGILSALAFLTHPMGALTHIVVGVHTLFSKPFSLRSKLYALLSLGIPTLFGTLLWLMTMIPVWNIFRTQWAIQLLRKTLSEPYIVFLWHTNTAFLVVAIVTLILLTACLLYRKTRMAGVLLGIATLWALWGREMWYITYITPCVAYTVVSLLKEEKLRGIGLLIAGGLMIANLHMLQDTASPLVFPDNHNPYYRYTAAIAEKVPSDAKILVSAIPDPSFGLSLRTTPYEFIHDHVTTPAIYQAHLDTLDYVVINLFSDPILPAYTKANAEKETLIDAGGYKVLLVKLVPHSQRKHI